MENAKKFFEETIKTEEAKAIIDSLEKPCNEDEVVDAYIEIANKLGVALTAEDIAEYLAADKTETGELDDSELEQLVGGGDMADCKYSYQQKENCWFQDACDNAWKDYDGYLCNNQSEGASIFMSIFKGIMGAKDTATDVIKDRNNGSSD